MSEKSFLKRRWKLILNILTVAALVGLAIAIRHQLVDTFKNLSKVHVWALLLLIPIEILNYDSQARLYRHLFKIAGDKLSYKSLFKISLELNFVNQVFPSGGVSGISYFGLRMRREGVTGSRATLVQLMKLVLTFLSFEVILMFGLLLLAAVGKVNNLVILVGASVTTLLVVGTLGFTYVISDRGRITTFLTFFTKIINKLIHLVRPKYPETINLQRAGKTFEELHDNYMLFHQKYKELQAPFWWSFVMNLVEVLAVYVVYIAFGEWVNLGAVILAYAVANFAGLISVLPGGVGVYEALMTGVLVVAGVPAALSIPVVVMYRVLNTLIQLPPGYVLYHRSLRGGDKES